MFIFNLIFYKYYISNLLLKRVNIYKKLEITL